MKYHIKHLVIHTVLLFTIYSSTQQVGQPQTLKLNAITVEMAQIEDQQFTINDLIQKAASSQQQTNRKLVQHYFQNKVEKEWGSLSSEAIKLRIYDQFANDQKRASLQSNVRQFLETTLYTKFAMGELSQSFQKEIRENPAEYFLNADMYDLIIDEQKDL